ncbi:MAG: GNAT family N-acetyltransferase [Armatimonadaceae bacterium]
MAAAFAAIGWNKSQSQFARYFSEQEAGKRVTLTAFRHGIFCGYINIVWESDYPPFREAGIPEIQDFNVLPEFRCCGIGTRLIEEAEQMVQERSLVVGIGVGLHSGYGAAQRLYARRGYIPDGRGVAYNDRFPLEGELLPLDDSLVLHLTKSL